MSTVKFYNIGLGLIFTVVLSFCLLSSQPSRAAEDKNALVREQLAVTQQSCPAGPSQRDCIYAYRKADTESYDAANPAESKEDEDFRACTTPRALELETQYVLDMLQLGEQEWDARGERFNNDVQENWKRCGNR